MGNFMAKAKKQKAVEENIPSDLYLPGVGGGRRVPEIAVETFRQEKRPLLVVSVGLGRDSLAMLILFWKLGIRPDLLLFADTGNEKPATYVYIPILRRWLKAVGFPDLTIVRAARTRDASLESMCLRLGIFPSLAYSHHKCSVQWKIEAQNLFLKTWKPAIEAKRRGEYIVRAIGFEAGEEYRAKRADENAVQNSTGSDGCKRTTAFALAPDEDYISYFPLIEQKIDFDGVIDLIVRAGLKIPVKSACFMCPASKTAEIYQLSQNEPHLFFRSLVMERVVNRNQVKPAGRVKGLDFGKLWGDLECAAPYLEKLDQVIDIFQLDRSIEDGIPNPKNEQWKPKAFRVELFREAFGTKENLALYMKGKFDFASYVRRIENFTLAECSRLDSANSNNQAELPLAA